MIRVDLNTFHAKTYTTLKTENFVHYFVLIRVYIFVYIRVTVI